MTETIEIPSDIGRNDPCPCGSGKKYKKCHMRLHQAQREAEKSTRSVEQLVNDETLPFQVYKMIAQATENNLVALIWEMSHELGPFRAAFPEQSNYLLEVNSGKATLPAGAEQEFMRLRIDLPDAYILLARGADDPRVGHVTYELITLRANEYDGDLNTREVEHQGWRIWDIQTHRRDKSELEDADLSISEFGVGWHPRGLRDYPTHVRVEEDASSAGSEEE
ncbi:MAG: SEC-C domain-containing protein [Myxococcota bacterium]|nr:SEC-C domain-containing protein [Myxococcota bacterium]MEC9442669.1 SEC-C domain-containing protein [Myxococcota bacterium]